MSHDNRQEDIDKIKSLKEGDEYFFNMFQSGGAMTRRVSEYSWELYEIPLYGGIEDFYNVYTVGEINTLVDTGYDVFV